MNTQKVQQYVFFALLAAISIFFIWLISPFLISIFWSVVLAILFYPIYKDILKGVKKKALASGLTILAILIVVFLPLYMMGAVIFYEAQSLFVNISSNGLDGARVDVIEALSSASRFLEPYGFNQAELVTSAQEALRSAGSFLTGQIFSISKNIFGFVLNLVITLYILFFLLKDGDEIVKKIKHLLPLGKKREDMLFSRFASITRASVKGEFLVALTQGVAGGLLFGFAGVSSPALWGLAMAILALLPGIGTGLITVPTGIILILSGQTGAGITILAGGLLFVGLIDNFLRPYLVSKGTEIPDMLVLVSTLGGLFLFGLSGVIIGPLISGFFLTMWQTFGETYKDKLDEV